MEKTAKKPDIIEADDDSPPLPPWQIGCEDEDLATKKTALAPHSDCQPSACDMVVPSSTSDEDIEQSIPNSGQPQVEIIIHRPPPPSMLPRQSDNEEETPSAVLPSLPQIVATAVEDVVYDAVVIRSDANQGNSGAPENASWWKRNQKYMFVGLMALIIGAMAATIATLIGLKDDANTVVPVETASINDTQYTMSLTNTTTSTTKPSTEVS